MIFGINPLASSCPMTSPRSSEAFRIVSHFTKAGSHALGIKGSIDIMLNGTLLGNHAMRENGKSVVVNWRDTCRCEDVEPPSSRRSFTSSDPIKLRQHVPQILSVLLPQIILLQLSSAAPYPSLAVCTVHYCVGRQQLFFNGEDETARPNHAVVGEPNRVV